MNYKKNQNNFSRIVTILFVTSLFNTINGLSKYDDSQILKLLDNHFKKNSEITMLGANIYTDKIKRTFQLEVSSTKIKVNKSLFQAFSVLFKLSSFSKNPIDNYKLIIHLENYDIPIIAFCDYKCSKKYLSSDKLKEKEWRDNCLIIKTI